MGVPGASIRGRLLGRANRKEYGLLIGVLLVVGFLLTNRPPIIDLIGASIVLYAQVRRLHDFGRSGWWAGAILLAQIPLTLLLFFTLGEEMTLVVGGLLVLVPILWIGAMAGDPNENRFGPPPGRRALKDVFS